MSNHSSSSRGPQSEGADSTPGAGSGGNAGGGDRWPRGDALDALLGLDALPGSEPRLRKEVLDAIRASGSARQESAPVGVDELLDLDTVEVPDGLADRVLAGLESERFASIRPAAPARRFFLLRGDGARRAAATALGVAAAAVAAVLLFPKGEPGDHPRDLLGSGPGAQVARGDQTPVEPSPLEPRSSTAPGTSDPDQPSDEFLASLTALEHLDFLTQDLDPLEADALFLLEAEDALLLELLEIGG